MNPATRSSQDASRLKATLLHNHKEDAPMIRSPATPAPFNRPNLDGDVPKLRQCLRCSDTFASEWFGARICPRCKSSNAWRNGSPVRSYPIGSRR